MVRVCVSVCEHVFESDVWKRKRNMKKVCIALCVLGQNIDGESNEEKDPIEYRSKRK